MSKTRKCTRCKETKSIDNFYPSNLSWCKECKKKATLNWQKTHREKYNAQRRAYHKIPKHRIAHNGRVAIRKIIKGETTGYKFLLESGALTRDALIAHLKSTTPAGYDFDRDYGNKLCIDHIIPCCAFDLTNREEYCKCFNYKNLRVVTIGENIKKGTHIYEQN